jgi:hypothetical protein
LLVGDILQVTPGKDAVSFMWSYPNYLPLPARTVASVVSHLEGKTFERLYGAFEGQNIRPVRTRLCSGRARNILLV